jgi:formylglycine-generating enzyme required for sulfatase activity
MGDEEGGYSGSNIERPPHTVTFANDFYVGKYEVTQAQWRAVMGADPDPLDFSECGIDSNCPVERVSWDNIRTFIYTLNNLSSETGKNYRLLSEAEWEYAAKAGTTTDTYAGDLDIKGDIKGEPSTSRNAPILDAISYYGGNSGVSYVGGDECGNWNSEKQYASEFCGTHHVGGKQPNAFGLYDMLGNVAEWTEDCYNESYNGAPVDGSAWLTGDCSTRVTRGGSWRSFAKNVRSSSRSNAPDDERSNQIGFRLAISTSEF